MRPALRVGLALLWVAWAVVTWWSAPRAATIAEAQADAAAGRIVAHYWADSFAASANDTLWFAPPQVSTIYDGPAQMLVWRAGFGRVHYALVADIVTEPGPRGLVVVEPNPADPLRAALPAGQHGNPIPSVASVLALTIALVCFAVLIQGPAPKLGTRWFWFFLGLLPFGLGVLLWLRAERPWTEPEPPAPDKKTGQPKRYTGLTGLGLLIVGGIVISILVALLRSLPEWLVPSALS
ncbi:hypothetical protein Asi02nite_57400 [Asanoa siamensis]|uniref:Uncharacterized protein n=1 Tax=Asanoa siamensis TaxID=926357 RepID=A0ABQ4CZD4_9ACTN|nr:hypothetical protein Asi02nite_57400 [Asanoa siamensis]